MILAELTRRGRGDHVLIVCPRHVLEQMQHELWTRFALPFVRLDSVGVQRVRQELPATRNPFTYFKRVIISIDTRFVTDLPQHRWDAVVIDESLNVTNSATHRLPTRPHRGAEHCEGHSEGSGRRRVRSGPRGPDPRTG
jgi:superfamily II DNA or RNA helicase